MPRKQPHKPRSRPTPDAREHADLPFSLPQVTPEQRTRAAELLRALDAAYPNAHCELNFRTPHELLVATILSAQATDASVNKATPALFAAFPTPADYAKASPAHIEPFIKSIGLYHSKAKAVYETMKAVVEKFGGQIPRTMDELLTLRGVARKTANVVLGNAYGINVGMPIDTHCQRLARRMALTPEDTSVANIERTLMALFPREKWCDVSHKLIFHGRYACKARGVTCDQHPICAKFGTACELRHESSKKTAGTSAKPKKNKARSTKPRA